MLQIDFNGISFRGFGFRSCNKYDMPADDQADLLLLELQRPVPEALICLIVKETLQALAQMHEKAIIHRDIKAGNILFTEKGVVKLSKEKKKKKEEQKGIFSLFVSLQTVIFMFS